MKYDTSAGEIEQHPIKSSLKGVREKDSRAR